jgi:amino-acid N-acetyltransferase
MTETITIQPAAPSDYQAVCELLSKHKLPTEDINKELSHFFIVRQHGSLVGVIGMEQYGEYGLLRSMATDPAFRNNGIASTLIVALFNYGKSRGLKEIYLLTETAENYFAKKGFQNINREQAPAAIKQSAEFSHLCPSTAVVMKKEIQ